VDGRLGGEAVGKAREARRIPVMVQSAEPGDRGDWRARPSCK